jgi:hypothetical protein
MVGVIEKRKEKREKSEGVSMKRIGLIFLILIFTGLGAQDYQVGDHELLIMPTATTMPKGSSYFTDYELFFLNYTYAITSRTHISAFTLFPLTTSFYETFSVGIKQNYFRSSSFQAALFGSYTFKGPVIFLGNVFSYRLKSFQFHLAPTVYSDGEEGEFIALGGVAWAPSRKTRFMIEYTNMAGLWEESFNGFLSVGFRFIGKEISFEIGGLRPLEHTGDLLFIPILKATKYFP